MSVDIDAAANRAAYEQLKASGGACGFALHEDGYDAGIDYVSILMPHKSTLLLFPGVAWPRAIPVTERLPQKPQSGVDTYLVFIDDGEPIGWDVAEWTGDIFRMTGNLLDITADVTHWLPTPPDPVAVG